MPPCHLRVVLGGGASGNAGQCVPRFACLLPNTVMHSDPSANWDCEVALSSDTASRASTHPAFFSQILAHELGHARVAVTDPALHVYSSFVDFMATQLSLGVLLHHELPHEAAHDRFGVWVAEAVLGRSSLKRDVSLLLAEPSRRDYQRLRSYLTLSPRGNHDTLRREIAAFATPFASEFVSAWDHLGRIAEGRNVESLPHLAPHISQLFAG